MPRQKEEIETMNVEGNVNEKDVSDNMFVGDVSEGEDGDDSDSYVEDSDSYAEDSDSHAEDKMPGNASWADAMNKVLNTKVSKEKFILSRAKKDRDIIKQVIKKQEIELVDESGKVIKPDEAPKDKSYMKKRKEMLDKQKQKAAWESMCRVKPDITNKEREKELVRIATRGVVHLFNTVEKHQKTQVKPKPKRASEKESLGAVKGSFMDMLRGQPKKQSSKDDPVIKKAKTEETWSILKDDFMMGAEMKDWDKDSDND